MYEYSREVHYYETDQMSVVHHANYIHWFEEARLAFLRHVGLPYERIEAGGVRSPVMGVNVRYRTAARFGDVVTVRVWMKRYGGMRFTVGYAVVNQEGKTLAEGTSDHCFIDREFRLVSLAKAMPESHALLLAHVEPDPA